MILPSPLALYSLAGLVTGVRLKSGRPGFDSRLCRGSFSRTSRTSNQKIGTPVSALLGAWCYRVVLGLVGKVSAWVGDCRFYGISVKPNFQNLFFFFFFLLYFNMYTCATRRLSLSTRKYRFPAFYRKSRHPCTRMIQTSEPGIRRGNEDSPKRKIENRGKNCFPRKTNSQAYFDSPSV